MKRGPGPVIFQKPSSATLRGRVLGAALRVAKVRCKKKGRRRSFRAGEAVSPAAAGAVAAAAGGIALRTAAQLRPPAPAEYRRRHARRHRRTRLQCAVRHPRRSISLPSIATLTRSLASHAIIGVKSLSTARVQFSPGNTRDRYLARRAPRCRWSACCHLCRVEFLEECHCPPVI